MAPEQSETRQELVKTISSRGIAESKSVKLCRWSRETPSCHKFLWLRPNDEFCSQLFYGSFPYDLRAVFFPSEFAIGQADNEIAPVKESDQIEVKHGSTWYPGTVLDYANNFAKVNYKWRSTMFDGKFAVENMQFPNGEGPWQEWTDASKSFSVIARYIARGPTHVTLRKQRLCNGGSSRC